MAPVAAPTWTAVEQPEPQPAPLPPPPEQAAEAKASEVVHGDKEPAPPVPAMAAESPEHVKEAFAKGWAGFKTKLANAPDPKQPSARPSRPGSGVTSDFSKATTPTGPQARSSTSGTYSKLSAVGQAQLLQTGMSKAERPPDAFTLLKDAREKGVLFVEDAMSDGHTEDRDDPELAEAVEECIRQCFGVRGILRIGPGRNDKGEPVVIVVVTNGFTDVSLQRIPAKVHRFETLTVIPFELLPLKRETSLLGGLRAK